jgi:GNAT superfamily N-acetyltransferase
VSDIGIATPAHRDQVVETLVAAFTADPVLRHLFPDDATYPEYSAAFFGHLFDKRVHRDAVWIVGEGRSVAIWEPPALAGATHPTAAISLPREEQDRMRGYDDAVHAALPDEPYWYLGVLGTHPEWTGRRWGHAVMEAGLRRAAEEGLPAILETSTPGNVAMYQRAGWEVIAELTEPLPIWVLRSAP